MDKYEYKIRSEEIKDLIANKEYAQAAEIADTIDWRRVKSVMMLCTISDLYKINRRFEDARDLLLLAYERRPGGRNICFSLCELSIKTGEIVQATEYYKEFVQVAPKDPGRYILQYKLYEDQDVSLEERIEVLEELKKQDYREKWAYELAYLYHRVGLATRCVEECDEMILWFGEGEYVTKAMELKMLHQPLSEEQQEKYDHRFDARQEAEEASEMIEDGQYEGYEGCYEENIEQGNGYAADVVGGDTQIFDPVRSEDNPEIHPQEESAADPAEQSEEMDIQVKTVDVGQYNTINLQAELAQGLQELLSSEQETAAPVAETAETEEVQQIEESASAEADRVGSDVSMADEAESSVSETGEIVLEQMRREIDREKEALQHMADVEPPKELAHVLSQESDGQISLVVPEHENVERQITGQMNIEDVLAEWERMKKENEEKRKEDVRRHVRQQTGRMFTEFEASVRDGLLEQLEKNANEAENILTVSDETSEKMEAIEPGKAIEAEVLKAEIEDTEAETTESQAETMESQAETMESQAETTESQAEENAAASDQEAAGRKAADQAAEDGDTTAEETGKISVRSMTREEKELYADYIQSRSTKEQIVKAVDNISLAAYTGNVIITGEAGMDTLSLAKNMIREVQATDSNLSGKVAKISAQGLNRKNIEETLNQLQNGALIVQNACDMNEATVQGMYKALQKESLGIVVLLQDERKTMNRFLKKYEILLDVFTARVDVEALSNDMLVSYGKQYAKGLEFSIDELGILALHNRIEQRQTIDHAVTTSEVKEIVDGAIRRANRKTPGHFFDILLAKRYDEEDMIVVTEKDFA